MREKYLHTIFYASFQKVIFISLNSDFTVSINATRGEATEPLLRGTFIFHFQLCLCLLLGGGGCAYNMTEQGPISEESSVGPEGGEGIASALPSSKW